MRGRPFFYHSLRRLFANDTRKVARITGFWMVRRAQEFQRRARLQAIGLGRALRDWSYPVYLLTWRLFVVLFGLVVLFLPIHAFLSEGAHTEALRASAANLLWSMVDAAKARPIVAAGVLIALGVTAHQITRLHLSKRKIREILEAHHAYLSTHREMVEDEIMPLFRGQLTESKYLLVIAHVNHLLSTICTRLSRTFEIVTNSRCCVTIKIIDQAGNISTHMRDLQQNEKRLSADEELPIFNYRDNTAFRRCVDENENYYLANWLPVWWILRQYRNKHVGWFKLYSATVVLPLRLQRNGQIVAFLCVDNLVGKFPRALTLELLRAYRGSICELLGLLGRIRRRNENV
jgi:hypothetical protein